MDNPVYIAVSLPIALALVAIIMVVLQGRRVSRLSDRILGVEHALHHLPRQADIHRIEIKIGEIAGNISGEMQASRERLRMLTSTVDRIDGYLIARKEEE